MLAILTDLFTGFFVFIGVMVCSYVIGRILCGIFFHLLDKRTRSRTRDSGMIDGWPTYNLVNLSDHYEWELDSDYTSNPQGFRLVDKK